MRDSNYENNTSWHSFKDDYRREFTEYDTPESIRKNFETQKDVMNVMFVVIITFALTLLAFFLMAEFFKWLYVVKYQLTIKIGAAAGLFLCGFLLFLFKRKLQYLYGISEVTFGTISAWFIFSKFFEPKAPMPYIEVIAAAYIIVRGLSNCAEASDKAKGSSEAVS